MGASVFSETQLHFTTEIDQPAQFHTLSTLQKVAMVCMPETQAGIVYV